MTCRGKQDTRGRADLLFALHQISAEKTPLTLFRDNYELSRLLRNELRSKAGTIAASVKKFLISW